MGVLERVNRGVEYIETHYPGQELDLPRLDMRDSCCCVIGQLEGDYDAVLELMEEDLEFDPIAYGFSIAWDGEYHESSVDENWDVLTVAWRDAIARRRLEAGTAREPVEATGGSLY